MNGFKVNAISSGENKLDLADFKPLSEEAQARLQANVTKWHDRFKADINLKRTAPESSMTGLTYEGMEAVPTLADAVVNDLDSVLALMANL
jgi:ClpP class serine protease